MATKTPRILIDEDLVILKNIQNSGVDAGGFTSGAWQTVVFNTEDIDTDGLCSLSSNQFTLSAGDWEIEASAPAFSVNRHQTKLYNVTGTANILLGTSERADATNTENNRSFVIGRFTIAASQALELQHQCETTKATNGMGVSHTFGQNVYGMIKLRKVG